jgi:two-component system, NtrC family, response regulator AtoC
MSSVIKNETPTVYVNSPFQATALLGYSKAMNQLRYQINRVATTDVSVFLLGESGTGKELVAAEIHAKSLRKNKLFLPINCGAISPQLIESELFGHEKGSFTGADRLHRGYFERANEGTLFLDEIIEMPVSLQAKFLRVLETGKYTRVGGDHELQSDVRIIAATNQNPSHAIKEGYFRLDFYHRLNTFPIQIAALRERGEDIELLARHFLNEFNYLHGTKKTLSTKMMPELRRCLWPGNVRELKNFIQRACILADDVVDLPAPVGVNDLSTTDSKHLAIRVGITLVEVDRQLILATLTFCSGAKKRAAGLLGISLKTLYNRLEEYSDIQQLQVNAEACTLPRRYTPFILGENHV